MKRLIFVFPFFCFLLVQGCAAIAPVGSKDHKATILYFEGGSGKMIDMSSRWADDMLINRSSYYFTSAGIRVNSTDYSFPIKTDDKGRVSEKHFQDIQKKVFDLKKDGHNHIWLMGISMGAISVMYAGGSQIKGVEGIVALNPPMFSYSGMTKDLNKIELPFLVVTHQHDGSNFKNYSNQMFKKSLPSSPNPKLVVLTGGLVGSSVEATQSTQKYQHGFRGKEKEFAQTVIDFILSNQKNEK